MRALGASRTSLVPGGVLAGPWVRDSLWRRARAVPSLDMRFADNKSLVDAVTGASLVTFTRASSKTVTNSARVLETVGIDVPAFDHNPTTGESLGLLVEEQRTNLLTFSEQFDNAAWTNNSSSEQADAAVAPNGTTTADKLIENNTTNVHGFARGGGSESLVNGTVYTFSVYAKAAERTFVYLQATSTFVKTYFNLSTGVVSATGAGHTPSIIALANGWYRCVITFTSDTTNNSIRAIGMAVVSGTESYAGDDTSGLFLWGAQLEAGAFPTSYIPTTTAAVTRSADVASITGSAFSSWYSQSEGTVFCASDRQQQIPATDFAQLFFMHDGSNNNTISLGWLTAGGGQFRVRAANVNEANLLDTVTTLSRRIIGAYAVNNVSSSVNGSTPSSDTSVALPTGINALAIGSDQAGATRHNGTIRRLVYWKQSLPASTLQNITQ